MMERLVYTSQNGNPITTSRIVAAIFRKRHSDVMRAIKNMKISNDIFSRNFALVSINDLHNPSPIISEQKHYIMTRDGFTLLVMGFTGEKAMDFKVEFLKAFNDMDRKLKEKQTSHIPKSFAEALRLAAYQAERLELAAQKEKENAPKIVFADALSISEDTILIGELAKILNQNGIDIGQNRLFKWLRDHHFLCKDGSRYNHPTQKAMDMKLFEVKVRTIQSSSEDDPRIASTTKVTGKGQQYFVNRFLKQIQV